MSTIIQAGLFFPGIQFNKKERALALIDSNRSKYALQVQAGHALYIDHLFALRQPQSRFLATTLPHKRAKWLEHNTYYVLFTSDEYVWCYSENELVGEQDTRWS